MELGGWVLGNRESAWIVLVLAAVGLVLVVWSVRRSPLRGFPLAAAVLSKALALVLLMLLLLEPQRVREVPRKGANDVIVLADNSASLAVADPAAREAPSTALRAALGGAEGTVWQRRLRETFRLQRFAFDSRVREAPDFAALDFRGSGSALISALDTLLRRYEKRPLAAVVVLTDGNATDEAHLQALTARRAQAPVFLVAAGRDVPVRDLALGEVSVTQTAFEDSPISVNARVTRTGFGEEELTLVIRDESGKVVLTQKERPVPGEASHVFHARLRPAAKGVSFYTAEVAAAGRGDAAGKETGEATEDNNRRVFVVDRKSGPYRVLYVGGRPNWEYKFLRRALEADDEIKLTALIRIAKREPKFQWRGRTGEESNPLFRGFGNQSPEEALRYDQPVIIRLGLSDKGELAAGFPAAAEDWFGAFRCVILDDVEAEFFTRSQLDMIERFVSLRGGSLLMLGGQECYQAGGYALTPVGRMLPVRLDVAGGAGPVEDARFKLTREGWLEPWMRLRHGEADEEARQGEMTPFFSVNAVAGIKPGASVLAVLTDPKRGEIPAWVAQRFGAGRAAAVTVGDLWRWALANPAAHSDFDKAWRQWMRHLVVDVPDRAELQLVARSDGARPRWKIQVRVRDRAFRPVDDASVAVAVESPGGGAVQLAAEPSPAEAGLYEAAMPVGEGGIQRVKATVRDAEGGVIGEPVSGRATNPLADETASLVNHRALMERIAAWSGGGVLRMDELSSLAERLPKLGVPVKEARTEPLWHAPWVLALLVALLATEWWLRRRTA